MSTDEQAPAAIATTTRRSCCPIFWRGLLGLLAVSAAICTAAWFGRDWGLRSAADLWIVSDPVGPADVAVIFGGGVGDRPFAAAEFYQKGLVRKILVSNAQEGRVQKMGLVASEAVVSRQVLLKLGIPDSAIEIFGDDLSNTHQEVLALRAWAERSGIHSVIVPTEIFPSRRLRWMLDQAFGAGYVVRVPAIEPAEYGANNWWRHHAGLIDFQNEILKYIYYRLSY